MERVKLEAWECGEYIITIDGKPVGKTVYEKEGKIIKDWLNGAIIEIEQNTKEKNVSCV